MSDKKKTKKLTNRQKASRLFWGTLGPLLIVIAVACTSFALICGQIIRYYVRAETSRAIEQLNGTIVTDLDKSLLTVGDFANVASLTQNPDALNVLVHAMGKNLTYGSALYYASVNPSYGRGGTFLHSGDWQPPRGWDPSTRGWYKGAIAAGGDIHYESPYIDDDTGKLCVSISKAVLSPNKSIQGIVSVDIIMEDLTRMIEGTTISPNGKLHIIMEDGTYLTHTDKSLTMAGNYFENSKIPFTKEEWLDGKQKAHTALTEYFAVGRIGQTPWYIVIEGPLKDFTSQLLNTIYIFEVLLVLFSIVSSIFNIKTILNMRKDEQEMGKKIFGETQNLVVASKENAATSQDQSAAVKEIVATMEDSNALSENISTKIKDVSKIAQKSSEDVGDGVSFIEKNVEQLHAIFSANQQTIDGMKDLSDKIESIWDIVTLINNVADQAKIIAFNAELEASSAGEAGKSFRIVANEIRRLSDGIIDGTKEIKEKITEIQHASDTLILASESGTEKINAGYENAKDLRRKFESIKSSSEITAGSAEDITEIIQQQTAASEQILIALKQIAAGVENFTVATDNISASAENLRLLSEEMNSQLTEDLNKKK